MYGEHTVINYTSSTQQSWKPSHSWKLNNVSLNIPSVKEEITRETREYFGKNEDEQQQIRKYGMQPERDGETAVALQACTREGAKTVIKAPVS